MLSSKSTEKSIRSQSIHGTVERDYDRKKRQQIYEIKHEKGFQDLSRRMASSTKRPQRAERKAQDQNRSTMTLDEYMQMERNKGNHMINAKKLANGRIRRN